MRGDWEWVGLGRIALHFAVPFLTLPFRAVKENTTALFCVALGVLVMRFVDVLWWVEPAFARTGPSLFWLLNLTALIALGGLWMWWFIGRLLRTSLEPVHDPNQCETGHD
jgi:hypothetical protein